MSLIYGEYLVNVHSSDIPHFTLHSAEKIRIKFSANYPLTTFRIPQSAKYPFPYRIRCNASVLWSLPATVRHRRVTCLITLVCVVCFF